LQKVENAENISLILYLVPLIASTIFTLYLWISEGLSLTLPETVYLTVTKDPYLFLIGFFAICLGILIEIYASPSDSKLIRFADNSKQIQILAFICIGSVILSVWSVSGYSFNFGRILQILLEGRYALVFPLLLFILSFLHNPTLKFNFLSFNIIIKHVSIFLLIASPLVFYGLWRIHVPWVFLISITLITLFLGIVFLYRDFDK